jgi:hypothetical protein
MIFLRHNHIKLVNAQLEKVKRKITNDYEKMKSLIFNMNLIFLSFQMMLLLFAFFYVVLKVPAVINSNQIIIYAFSYIQNETVIDIRDEFRTILKFYRIVKKLDEHGDSFSEINPDKKDQAHTQSNTFNHIDSENTSGANRLCTQKTKFHKKKIKMEGFLRKNQIKIGLYYIFSILGAFL